MNDCLKIVTQSGKDAGLIADVDNINACRFNIVTSYRRTSERNPAAAAFRGAPLLTDAKCAYPRGPLTATTQTIACTRARWGPASVTFDTDQGPVGGDAAAPAVPIKPVLDPPVPEVDVHTVTFQKVKHSLHGLCTANMRDGDHRWCSEDWQLPLAEGTITNVVSRPEDCQGGDPCRYAWASASWNGRMVTWRIHYNTPKDTTHLFHVTYTTPHVKTADELARLKAHEDATKTYEAQMVNGPCYGASKAKMQSAKTAQARN